MKEQTWTASVSNADQNKDIDLGTFVGTRAEAAKQAVAKIPADFPATMLYLNEVGTDSQAEYVHWLRGKRADLVVKRWYDEKMDEERDKYYAAYSRKTRGVEMVHGCLVVSL